NPVSDGEIRRFDGNGNRFGPVAAFMARRAFASDITSSTSVFALGEFSDATFTSRAGVGKVSTLISLPSIASGATCPPVLAQTPTASSGPTLDLSVSAVLIDPGADVTVQWSAANAKECTIVLDTGQQSSKVVPFNARTTLRDLQGSVLVT